jgi:hypothetical protein
MFETVREEIAQDMVKDILAQPPNYYDDLYWSIRFLAKYSQDYPYLNQDGILEWIQKAQELLNSQGF